MGRAMRPAELYFDAAYAILAEQGHANLKLSAICGRVGVTTGGFYHNFDSWRDFTGQFLEHWHANQTTRLVGIVVREPDPIVRLRLLLESAARLPHRAEAAIRAWSAADERVAAVQRSVDDERLQVVVESFRQMSLPPGQARSRGLAGMYLLIGYELGEAIRDDDALRWGLAMLIDGVDGLGRTNMTNKAVPESR
ncbi:MULTISPECIES: TetR/AcrR family transcriptional regulator [Gordonia]|jgi:AcrR family transcriptional regulator|nr:MULTISPECIES: TetR/AcrR family transcriptional regulator [Gordonia]MBD0023241.1 TetR family transcriptional regulator [Gordonia sp. (in: high G+C Gram-positive bacteria)]